MSHTRKPLGSPKSAGELLDMYYLDMRCHLLETAAAMDRIARAKESDRAEADPRFRRLLASLDILRSPEGDKAARFLELFSAEEDRS